jgi:hypothetical protein
MPGARVLSLTRAGVCYEAPGDPASALIFCETVLDERGWCENQEAGRKFVSPIFASACHEKSGYSLVFTARQTPGTPALVTVSLQNMGNVDTRTLPRHQDAILVASARTSTTYVTSFTVREVADFTKDALADLGWSDYALMEARRFEFHEHQTFGFAKDGMSLTVRVSLMLTHRGRSLVQYSTAMLAR